MWVSVWRPGLCMCAQRPLTHGLSWPCMHATESACLCGWTDPAACPMRVACSRFHRVLRGLPGRHHSAEWLEQQRGVVLRHPRNWRFVAYRPGMSPAWAPHCMHCTVDHRPVMSPQCVGVWLVSMVGVCQSCEVRARRGACHTAWCQCSRGLRCGLLLCWMVVSGRARAS